MHTTVAPRDATKGSPLTSQQIAEIALQAALEKKAQNPVLLDLDGESSYADYLLVLSGTSDRHVQTIADGIVEALAALRKRPLGTEGMRDGRWVLIDFGDVVVHVFYQAVREHYDLEGLWCDAKRTPLAPERDIS